MYPTVEIYYNNCSIFKLNNSGVRAQFGFALHDSFPTFLEENWEFPGLIFFFLYKRKQKEMDPTQSHEFYSHKQIVEIL